MARNHGRILTGIWADQDFRDRTPEAQRLYMFLLSQPNLNHAGLLPLTLRRWSRAAAGLTVPDVQRALEELAKTRFVVVDEDVEEVLIRSLVRRDNIWKQPKVMLAMESDALEITSPRLQAALLAELDRLDMSSLSDEPPKSGGESTRKVVQGVIDRLRKAFRNPSPGVSGTLSGAPPEASEEASAGTTPGASARGESSGDSLPGDPPPKNTTGYDKPAAQELLSIPGGPFQIGDAKGIGKGIADPHACAGAPSPAPAPTPAPTFSSAAAPRDGDEVREDVERICGHLADRIEDNGSKRPRITKAWLDAARLMLDKDGRTEEQARAAIDWCQNDEFWRANVLSMPTLRAKYDQLRLQASRTPGPARPNGQSRNARHISAARQRAIEAEVRMGLRPPTTAAITQGEINR